MSIFRLGRWRGFAALAAAYALALQALFGGIILARAVQADPLEICLAADGGADHQGSHKSAAHQNCILCSLAHQPALANAGAAIAEPLRFAIVAHRVSPAETWRTVLFRRDHYQRGPPAAAIA